MKPWIERPFEIRNLFNPAFCSVLLLRAIQGYEEEDHLGMPFSLSLLILPLCLHKGTRELFLKKKQSYFLKIVSDNPEVRVGFSERTTNLLPYAFEGLGLAMQHNSFAVTEQGRLVSLDKGIRKTVDTKNGTQESIECQQVARLLGKKFARLNDKVTIYNSLGIRP